MNRRNYPDLRETVYHEALSNGLNVYVSEKPEFRRQFAYFAVRYGGMDRTILDASGRSVAVPAGMAHFLEHKAFDSRDGCALRNMAMRGVDPNAYTTPFLTAYYFESVRDFEENLRDLLEFVLEPYFTKSNVEKEQGIIAQEIRMEKDDPDAEVYYRLLDALYASHPIRSRILGSEDSIAEITPEILTQCYQAAYQPSNMVLCVAGNVNPQRVASIAREALPERSGSLWRLEQIQTESGGVKRHYSEQTMPVSIPLFEIGFQGVPAPDGGQLRQRLLAELVCGALFSPSAPLYSRLYEQGLINGAFDSGYDAAPGCAWLTAGGESRDPKRVMEEVLNEAARLSREGIDPDLWERLKKAAYGGIVRQLNSLEGICAELAQGHFDGEEFFHFPECFQSIRRTDGEELIRQWCVEERAALSVIWPEED